jgi:hypothetical protein
MAPESVPESATERRTRRTTTKKRRQATLDEYDVAAAAREAYDLATDDHDEASVRECE